MIRSFLFGLALLGFCVDAALVSAQSTFPVSVRYQAQDVCTVPATLWSVDPATGRVSLDLASAFTCDVGGSAGNYPAPILTLASQGSLAASPASIGRTGSITLQFNTGLASSTTGMTCEPDGVDSAFVSVISGWSTTLCADCGSAVTRTVSVSHSGGATAGSIQFKAKCTYQGGDVAHPRIATVLSDIISTPAIAVESGACSAVEQLADPRGLTSSARQLVGTVAGGPMAGVGRDFTTYTAIFGTSSGTAAPDTSDPTGFGFPGTNATSFRLVMLPNRFTSLKFRVPDNTAWLGEVGSFIFALGQAPVSAVIAPCPGQFNTDPNFPVPAACSGGTKLDINWIITSGATEACKLEPGRTYYLNLVHGTAEEPTVSSCSTSGGCQQYLRRAYNGQ
jgi:hypothetical protein